MIGRTREGVAVGQGRRGIEPNVTEDENIRRREILPVGEVLVEGIESRAERPTAVEQPGLNRVGEALGVVARESGKTESSRIERGRSTVR